MARPTCVAREKRTGSSACGCKIHPRSRASSPVAKCPRWREAPRRTRASGSPVATTAWRSDARCVASPATRDPERTGPASTAAGRMRRGRRPSGCARTRSRSRCRCGLVPWRVWPRAAAGTGRGSSRPSRARRSPRPRSRALDLRAVDILAEHRVDEQGAHCLGCSRSGGQRGGELRSAHSIASAIPGRWPAICTVTRP